MVGEPAVEEQVAVQTPEPAPQEAAVEAPELDYRALYEASEAEKVTLTERVATLEPETQNIRSADIGLMKQAERDRKLAEVADGQTAIAEALASGEAEGLPAKLASIRQQHEAKATEAGFQEESQKVLAEIRELGKSVGADVVTDPAFENAGLYWKNALAANDPIALSRALTEAGKAARKIETQGHETALAAARTQGRDEQIRQQALEEAPVDLGSGGGGGVAITEANIDNLMANISQQPKEEQEKIKDRYRTLMRTGSLG